MQCQFEHAEGTLSAHLSGQFIFSDHTKFREILNAAEDDTTQTIRIDFSGIEFIDSAGLGMLLLLRDICIKSGKRLILARPRGQVKKVFDISKFEHLFSIDQ